MSIARPVTRTIVSTTDWGIPVTDEVNRLTAWQLAQVPTPWYNVVFANGWGNYSGMMTQYRKVGDIVTVRGGIAGGTIPTNAFVLPAGFRPPAAFQSIQAGWATVFGVVQFNSSDGGCYIISGDNRFVGTIASFSVTP